MASARLFYNDRAYIMKILLLKIWKRLPVWVQWFFSRLIRPLFQVFAVAVIFNEKNEVFLVKLTYQRKYPWGLPGGNLDYSEEPENAVVREVFEETGLKIEVKKLLLARSSGVIDQIGLFYWCELREGVFTPSAEVSDYGFFALNSLPDVRPSDVNFLRDLRSLVESIREIK